ncbi:MAG: hypothetical protein JO367_03730 [Actinobacteria bacterium]|nr:hypothetical protein [Actinomycetota bacterium]MBV8959361.1 hypothetical protein [Actinomycetota bacterium]MBV9933388.1 hypothetical protein [Actinomycetota bacterium]
MVILSGLVPRRLTPLALAAATLLMLTGCGVSGLSFAQDKRVDIVRPDDRKTITLPLTVEWTVKNFAVGDGQGSFGVFVDRAPQPSGRSLAWPFRGDRSCKGTGAALCAKPDFLAQHSVYQTTEKTFRVEQVSRLIGSSTRQHELTVVLLGPDGKRVGEGAWSVLFKVKGEKK